MDTRTILQIVLGIIVALIVIVTGITVYHLTREAETVVVKKVERPSEGEEERANPWEDKGDAAIALVKRVQAQLNDKAKESATIGELLEDETFVRETLKITSGKKVGWEAQWWGETKYGPAYFLVRFAFQDENIKIGPAWLVDLRHQKVVPKNVWAQVTENPEAGKKSPYYDKAQQVVSAITNHRFDSKINLGGALLLFFEQRASAEDDDTILGWTIEHDRGNLFKAYFQWVENNEPTYAEFEFDFDAKALKAVNLQAAEIMRVGEEFETLDRVSIMPGQYNPSARSPALRWTGPARKACRARAHRDRCQALATLLEQNELIEALEWLLTVQANTADAFEACKETRKCGWAPQSKGEGVYRINYNFNLGQEGQTISWDVFIRQGNIEPVDRISQLAYRAIHPRT